MMNSKLSSLLSINNIDIEDAQQILYQTLLRGVFEVLCKEIRKENTFFDEKKRYRNSKNHMLFARRLITKYVGCQLNDDELDSILMYISAFFVKDETRKNYSNEYRERLLGKQNNKCAVCGKKISSRNAHLDHIIPWDYVGDELKNNYQMLCGTCNERKGTSSYYELSMLLFNKPE